MRHAHAPNLEKLANFESTSPSSFLACGRATALATTRRKALVRRTSLRKTSHNAAPLPPPTAGLDKPSIIQSFTAADVARRTVGRRRARSEEGKVVVEQRMRSATTRNNNHRVVVLAAGGTNAERTLFCANRKKQALSQSALTRGPQTRRYSAAFGSTKVSAWPVGKLVACAELWTTPP